MSTARSRLGEFFTMFGAAVATAVAVRARRQPNSRDLQALGIDPKRFGQIRYYR